MDSEYIIKDNTLELSQFENLKNAVYNNLNWVYHSDTVGIKNGTPSFATDLEDNFEYLESEQFVSSIIHNGEINTQNTDNFSYFEPLLNKISLLLNKEIFIERVKVNSTFYTKHSDKTLFSTPHIDIGDNFRENGQSLSAIFYLQNRNDGTLLFNEKQAELNEKQYSKNISDIIPPFLTKKQYITSIENRLIVFPTNLFHAGCYTKHKKSRFIINLNFWVKND